MSEKEVKPRCCGKYKNGEPCKGEATIDGLCIMHFSKKMGYKKRKNTIY